METVTEKGDEEIQSMKAGFKLRGIRALSTRLTAIDDETLTQSVAEMYIDGSTPHSIQEAHKRLYDKLKEDIAGLEELRQYYADNDGDDNSE